MLDYEKIWQVNPQGELPSRIIDFHDISRFFLGWTSVHINEQWGTLFIAIGVLTIQWALMLFLYRKKIFLRV